MTGDMAIHQCGISWQYCDGNCSICDINKVDYSTTTDFYNTPNLLPTKEEYEKMLYPMQFYQNEWSDPKYQCERCGGNMRKNLMVVLTSNPPKSLYMCDKCGHVDYQYN